MAPKRGLWCGQLTDVGVEQCYELGTFLRDRYVDTFGFLPSTHSAASTSTKLHYISTNFTRTIQSADSVLRGLYPQRNRSTDNSDIAIHCDIASTWMYPNAQCRRSKEKHTENAHTLNAVDDPEMVALKGRIIDFYGTENRDKGFLYVAEALCCRLAHSVDLPPTDLVSKDLLAKFIAYSSERICKMHGLDRETLRLSHGVLLAKLVRNMKGLEDRFLVYSAHDGTLQRLLVSLANGKDFRFPWPRYAASLIFEVWERQIERDTEKEKTFVESVTEWFSGEDRTRAKYVRILYEGNVVYLEGDEFTHISRFEEMWSDVMLDEETYWLDECVC